MKRNSILLLIMAFLLIFSACGKNDSIDSETGEILLGDVKYEFADGVYTAKESYYYNGYIAYMRITVKDSIICSLSFDYRDNDNKDKDFGEESDSITNEIHSLTNQVLQDQIVDFSSVKQSDVTNDFVKLYNSILPLLSDGETKDVTVDFTRVYSVKYNYDERYDYRLDVTLTGENVEDVNFNIYNQNDQRVLTISDPVIAYNSLIVDQEGELTYDEVIEYLKSFKIDPQSELDQIEQLKKDAPCNSASKITAIFNSLVNEVEDAHKKVK